MMQRNKARAKGAGPAIEATIDQPAPHVERRCDAICGILPWMLEVPQREMPRVSARRR
ncbi:hypothetical protein [Sphingomonas bisphenolicum]